MEENRKKGDRIILFSPAYSFGPRFPAIHGHGARAQGPRVTRHQPPETVLAPVTRAAADRPDPSGTWRRSCGLGWTYSGPLLLVFLRNGEMNEVFLCLGISRPCLNTSPAPG